MGREQLGNDDVRHMGIPIASPTLLRGAYHMPIERRANGEDCTISDTSPGIRLGIRDASRIPKLLLTPMFFRSQFPCALVLLALTSYLSQRAPRGTTQGSNTITWLCKSRFPAHLARQCISRPEVRMFFVSSIS